MNKKLRKFIFAVMFMTLFQAILYMTNRKDLHFYKYARRIINQFSNGNASGSDSRANGSWAATMDENDESLFYQEDTAVERNETEDNDVMELRDFGGRIGDGFWMNRFFLNPADAPRQRPRGRDVVTMSPIAPRPIEELKVFEVFTTSSGVFFDTSIIIQTHLYPQKTINEQRCSVGFVPFGFNPHDTLKLRQTLSQLRVVLDVLDYETSEPRQKDYEQPCAMMLRVRYITQNVIKENCWPNYDSTFISQISEDITGPSINFDFVRKYRTAYGKLQLKFTVKHFTGFAFIEYQNNGTMVVSCDPDPEPLTRQKSRVVGGAFLGVGICFILIYCAIDIMLWTIPFCGCSACLKRKQIEINDDSSDDEKETNIDEKQSAVVDVKKKQSVVVDVEKKQSAVVDAEKKQSVVVDVEKKQSVVVDVEKSGSQQSKRSKKSRSQGNIDEKQSVVVDVEKSESQQSKRSKKSGSQTNIDEKQSVVVDVEKSGSQQSKRSKKSRSQKTI